MKITGDRRKDGLAYHSKKACKGTFCPFHNPSKHKMRDWPMNLRMDSWAFPLIERICPHGTGHPDPDSVAYLNRKEAERNKRKKETVEEYLERCGGTWGVHGCDGCCGE